MREREPGIPAIQPERSRQRRAEVRILRREFDALLNYAQGAYGGSGRGCLLVGLSRSLAELQGSRSAVFLLLDYFSEQELRDAAASPAANPDSADSMHTAYSLVQTYDPAFECIAVFLGAGGWSEPYRLSRAQEDEKISRCVRHMP